MWSDNTNKYKVKKMKMKRKIMTILIALFLVAISVVTVEAGETTQIEQKEEPILVEITSVLSDGSISSEILETTETELAELENFINSFMEKIEHIDDPNKIESLIEQIFSNTENNGNIIGKIFGFISGLKIIKNRIFVVSSCHSVNYNPLDKISFKIRKKACLWHYNSKGMFNDRTIILQPFKLQFKNVKGPQVGYMTRFTGMYLSVSKGFLKERYTCFLGIARHANGFGLSVNR